MGFSVSGSFAVIVIGTFIAFGLFYGAASNAVENVTDAQQEVHHGRLALQNTAIEITRANWRTSGDCGPGNTCLLVDVENTGSTALSIDATDLFVDGYFIPRPDYSEENVEGDTSTELWLPGEQYHVELQSTVLEDFIAPGDFPPERVKVVTKRGVADSREVA